MNLIEYKSKHYIYNNIYSQSIGFTQYKWIVLSFFIYQAVDIDN